MPRLKSHEQPDDDRAKQERFVKEYIANGYNATQAALSSGASNDIKRARYVGMKLMKRVYVQQLVQEHKDQIDAELKSRYAITRENVLDALSNLVFGSPKDLFREDGTMKPIHELDDRTARMISSMDVEEIWDGPPGEKVQVGVLKKVRMWDKNSAIDKAMRHLGLFEKDNAQKPAVVNLSRDDAGVL